MTKPSRPIEPPTIERPNGNGAQTATQQARLREIDLRLSALMQELHFTLQPRLKVIAINPQLVADADVQIVLIE